MAASGPGKGHPPEGPPPLMLRVSLAVLALVALAGLCTMARHTSALHTSRASPILSGSPTKRRVAEAVSVSPLVPTPAVARTENRIQPCHNATHHGDAGSIPRLIHQSWKSADHIPARFRPWLHSWAVHHPDWCYVFWDDNDNQLLIHHHFPKFKDLYSKLPSGVARADFARYALLHHFGGVYADSDFECRRSFNALRHYPAFVGSEPMAHAKLLEGKAQGFLCNALMASQPRHPFWLRLMDRIDRAHRMQLSTDPVTLTGPRMLHRAFDAEDPATRNVTAFPEEYFYPEIAYWNIGNMQKSCSTITSWNEKECGDLKRYPRGHYTNNTYAVHHWECTWCRSHPVDGFIAIAEVIPKHQLVRPTQDGWLVPQK